MKRIDGRKPDELRPLVIKAGVINQADGSAMVKLGNTTAVAAVYGPRLLHPKHLQEPDRAYLRTVYSMVPFSTYERVKPGPSRRSIEICKVTRHALEPAIFLEEFPKTVIDVFIDIIEADAGTRTAGINAASVALADAGIPMKGLVSAVAVGKINDTYILDLNGKEEEETFCDMPVAYINRTKEVSLLQMDGKIDKKDIKELLKLALKGCEIIYEEQKKALKNRWIGD
ncbi:MAG: exosome complex exonuclease Rrp41 [Candidatus Aenigmatarchaeota archaeon]|nr:MAG: exosome complex exonuclease Rrp41 [Candidatus Aenigmarchaeota archaeon]